LYNDKLDEHSRNEGCAAKRAVANPADYEEDNE
jgi:hypothetical protein